MLYEYNGKIYIKPFSNKIVEVEIIKKGNEYNVKPLKEIKKLTQEIREKMSEITLENAYKRISKTDRNSLDTL